MTAQATQVATGCAGCGWPPVPGDSYCRQCGRPLLPPAGWYANPDGRGGWRFWDGAEWTAHTRGAPAAAAPAAAARQRPMPPPEPGLPGLGVAAVSLVAAAASAIGVVAALDALGRPGGSVTALLVSEFALWAWLVGAVVHVSRSRGTGSIRRDFGWRIARSDVGIGVLGAVVARSTSAVVVIPLYAAFHDLLRNPHIGLPVRSPTGGEFAAYAVLACVGAPIVEELFFRGLVQTRLVGLLGPARGIAVASAVFGAAHLLGWQGPATLLSVVAIAASGAVLGYLRLRTGRLGTSTVAHALFNSVAILLLGLGVA